jgi:hypothetical protein
MGSIGKDFKFKIIKNLLTKDEIDLLGIYGEIKHRINFKNFDLKQSNNGDTYFYGDPIVEALMLKKKNIIEKETNKSLLPSYAFWRMYTKFATLEKHTDRPSCEISVTLNISSDGTKWPIFMDGTPIDLDPGDGAVYLGCEVNHWREEFFGDYQMQIFMHYVDSNGQNKDYHLDKRKFWGLEK